MQRFNYTARTKIFEHLETKYGLTFFSIKANTRTNRDNAWICLPRTIDPPFVIRIEIDGIDIADGNKSKYTSVEFFDNTKEVIKMIENTGYIKALNRDKQIDEILND